MRLLHEDRVWLTGMGLVDPEVDLARVRVHTGGAVGLYLRLAGRGAITFGRHVFIRDRRRRRDLPLLAHELVHVAQYRRLGMLRFLAHYTIDLLRFRGYGRRLPLEAPAYDRGDLARRVLRTGRAA